ncbi:DUF4157 domain-containing protein [Streptomyces sp. NPDC004111]|uniref:eCIS core domain-containing protein n=1 Tax=Streptomyces sp. NPDC004111 TaxID=3364690 RepID=UPI0036A6BAB0
MVHQHSSAKGPDKANATARAAAPVRESAFTALQRTAGNAAVARMLQRAGHLQEQHEHGAGCGHGEAVSEQPAVQRSAVHDVLARPGRPLDDARRTEMETRLDADFSDVRIHDDSAARASAAEVGARAYTSGSHVVIGQGGGDMHTLAHELTHVIQQRRGPVAGTDNGAGLRVSDPSDRFEREAEANAHRAMSGRSEAAPAVQRRPADSPAPSRTPVVQRIEYPADPGEMLQQGYWEGQAGGKAEVSNAQKGLKKALPKGTQRRLSALVGGVANKLLEDLDRMPEGSGSLKLYRAMDDKEADAVLAWAGTAGVDSPRTRTESWIRQNPNAEAKDWHAEGGSIIPAGSHLGDVRQSHEYIKAGRMLEFTLKPGAHKLLFDPEYTALANQGDAPAAMHKALSPNATDPRHASGNAGEGNLGGYLGIKAERHGYFSINPGKATQQRDGSWQGGPGHLLFQMFLAGVQDVTHTYQTELLPGAPKTRM